MHRAAGGHPITIAPAEGRGSGAFAAAPIPAGCFLEQYLGERVDDAELVRRYGADFFASEDGGEVVRSGTAAYRAASTAKMM